MTTLTDTIVVALFDSVWQDAVLAVALWVALRALRQRSAAVRYIVSCAALAAMVIWPVASGVDNAVRLVPQGGATSIIAAAVPMTPARTPQEQLGLKLEPSRAPLDVIVIDRVERPTPD